MKATDLMIGDLVFNNFLNKNIRITPFDFFSKYPKVIEGYDLEPILLTAEILELNGWQYGDWGDEYESDEYFTNETIGFDLHINDKKEFEIRCVDAVNITLKYVHELQHALKLCGIEKDIEL